MKGRTYRFMSDPLFPFGFGLSYTTFLIGNASFSKASVKANEPIELTIPVSNTGKRAGTEIIQVYIRKINDTGGPIKTLRSFQRVDMAAGKSGKAVINLPYNSFEFFNRATGKMIVTAGEYEVLYGNSSDAKDLKMQMITIL
jgi:beta-glucosidase